MSCVKSVNFMKSLNSVRSINSVKIINFIERMNFMRMTILKNAEKRRETQANWLKSMECTINSSNLQTWSILQRKRTFDNWIIDVTVKL